MTIVNLLIVNKLKRFLTIALFQAKPFVEANDGLHRRDAGEIIFTLIGKHHTNYKYLCTTL